jgi:hypothetical protein
MRPSSLLLLALGLGVVFMGCAVPYEPPVFRLDQPQPNGQHAVIEGYRDPATGGTRLVLTCSGGTPAENAQLCEVLKGELLYPTVPPAM